MRTKAPLYYTGSVVAFAQERNDALLWTVTLSNWSEGVGFTYDLLAQDVALHDVRERDLRPWVANNADRARLGL